jgi:hypothetical protein
MMQRYGEGVPAAAAAVAMLISIGDRCSEACPVIICPVVRLHPCSLKRSGVVGI